MNLSLLALIDPTWAISSLLVTGFIRVLQVLDDRLHGLVDAAANGRGIAPRGHVPQPFLEDRPGQHGGRGGAVAGNVGGLRGDLVDQLGAHILEAVVQLHLLADRDAVFGHGG